MRALHMTHQHVITQQQRACNKSRWRRSVALELWPWSREEMQLHPANEANSWRQMQKPRNNKLPSSTCVSWGKAFGLCDGICFRESGARIIGGKAKTIKSKQNYASHHFTLKRDSPFFLDAFTPTMAALFSLPMLLLLRENCREVTSSCLAPDPVP